MKLSADFYLNNNVIEIAQNLLGKVLYTNKDGIITAGIIVETEAYKGIEDKASHAYGGRRTNRTETMYNHGGIAYVYLCYGMHHLFNVVTSVQDEPHAVLIRAVEPLIGLEIMLERRMMDELKSNLTSGPGSVAKALGIDKNLNAKNLKDNQIWIEDHDIYYSEDEIIASSRIGIAYAQEHALLPWRFYVKGNRFVSKPNKR